MPNICYNHIRINGSYWDLEAIRKRGRVTFMYQPPFYYKDRTTTIYTNEFSLEGFIPAPPIVKVQYQDPNDPITPAVAYCERHGLVDQKIRFLCGNKTGEVNRFYSENPSYWHNWRNEHWGTKWDTRDACVDMMSNELYASFDTAWAPPEPVFEELSRQYSDVMIECTAEIEGWENYRMKWQGGQKISEEKFLNFEDMFDQDE